MVEPNSSVLPITVLVHSLYKQKSPESEHCTVPVPHQYIHVAYFAGSSRKIFIKMTFSSLSKYFLLNFCHLRKGASRCP